MLPFFVLSLWLAHFVRSSSNFSFLERQIESFDKFVWLFLIIIPGVPLVLESQGFYNRLLLCKRRQTAWILFKSCALCTFGIILVMFFFKKADLARSVILLFGGISFLIMLLKEELLRWAYKSRFGQLQLKKRVMLLGFRRRHSAGSELSEKGDDNFEVVAELDLNEGSVSHLITCCTNAR